MGLQLCEVERPWGWGYNCVRWRGPGNEVTTV